jgi:gas vesicle protein
MKTMGNTSRLVWFVAGASIGATLALLFAPQSGKDTRRYIGKQARRSQEAITDAGRDALDKGRDLYSRGLDLAEEAANEASELFDRGRRILEG